MQDRVADHADVEHVVRAAGGGAHLGELLELDHGLEVGQTATAVLGGPLRCEETGLVQHLAPLLEERQHVVGGDATQAGPALGQVGGQEGLDSLAELGGLSGIFGGHAAKTTSPPVG